MEEYAKRRDEEKKQKEELDRVEQELQKERAKAAKKHIQQFQLRVREISSILECMMKLQISIGYKDVASKAGSVSSFKRRGGGQERETGQAERNSGCQS